MSNLSRKDFLRLTSWSLVATLLPIGRIEALNSILTSNKSNEITDFENAVIFSQQAKNKFYLKNYFEAETLYMQAIQLAPNYIQFYDGLDNVFGAQSRFLDSVLLFKNALLLNTANVAFYDRAARSLLRLQTGCRSVALDYRNQISSASLLADAVILYQSALNIDNTKQYLNIGLSRVNRRINIAPLEDNYKVNRVFKNLKNQNRNVYKTVLNNKSNEELKQLIERIDSKKRRELTTYEEIIERKINTTIQKKKFYDILQKRENISELDKIENAEKLFEIDYKDSTSLHKIKVIYYSNNKFFEFIEIRRRFADASKTFSGYLGLMDSMELAFKKGQAGSEVLQEAISIGYTLKNEWSLMFQRKVDLIIKMVKILLIQSRYPEAKELIEEIMPKVKLESYSVNNKLIYFYSKIYFEEGNLNFAKNCLLIGTKELEDKSVDQLIGENPKYSLVRQLANNKQKDEFKNNLDLYYLIYLTYFSLGMIEQSIEVINRLLENNPQDSFVLTRS